MARGTVVVTAAAAEVSAGWPAPAKINRFLHIVGRRADGYHELETLFQFLDLADELAFTVNAAGGVTREGGPPGLAAEADLVVRAARALQQATGCPLGCHIRVDKHLPAGGGLGGGSSDAATTLVALNELWGTGLDTVALAAIGLTLGADVPVFVHGHAAWAEGVGETLTPMAPDEPWFVIIDPAVSVSTAEVFGAPKLTRHTPRIRIPRLDTGSLGNDCEAVVRERYPAVGEALDWLGRFAGARLSGTGGCVFAPFAREDEARSVCARVPPHWRGYVARGLNRSPLVARWDAVRAGDPADYWGVAKR